MKVYKLSASNIGTFLDCPYKYKLKYNDLESEIEPDNPWGPPGSAFHKAVQRYLTDNPNNKTVNHATFLELLAEEFGKYGVGIQAYKDYVEYLKGWLYRVEFNHKIIGIEKDIDITLPNGIPVKMILDLVEEVDDKTIQIRDWKTGQVYDEDRMKENIQAPMYILGAKQLYPDKNIIFFFDFIKYVQLEYKYDNDSMKNFVKYLQGIYNTILNMDPENAHAKMGSHCSFCGYHDKCPAIKKALEQGVQASSATMTSSLDDLIDNTLRIDEIMKGLKNEKDRLRSLILDKMENTDISDYVTDAGSKAKLTQRKYVKYDVEMVCRIFSKYGKLAEVIKVEKGKVDDELSHLPDDIQAEIEAGASTDYGKQSITITRKRGVNGKRKSKKTDKARDDQLW